MSVCGVQGEQQDSSVEQRSGNPSCGTQGARYVRAYHDLRASAHLQQL